MRAVGFRGRAPSVWGADHLTNFLSYPRAGHRLGRNIQVAGWRSDCGSHKFPQKLSYSMRITHEYKKPRALPTHRVVACPQRLSMPQDHSRAGRRPLRLCRRKDGEAEDLQCRSTGIRQVNALRRHLRPTDHRRGCCLNSLGGTVKTSRRSSTVLRLLTVARFRLHTVELLS